MAYRRRGDVVEYLLVTPRRRPTQRIFPKGHVEPNEQVADAARRELAEEAGIVAPDGEFLASASFKDRRGRSLDVAYYIFHVDAESDVDPEVNRRGGWFSFAKALEHLTFPEARRILQAAHRRVATADGEDGLS